MKEEIIKLIMDSATIKQTENGELQLLIYSEGVEELANELVKYIVK